LLQYCYEHNEKLIERIRIPETGWLDQDDHLILAHNALDQLDVTPSTTRNRHKHSISSLFSVVDNTSTLSGKRYLLNMLTNPITESKGHLLQLYYDMTEDMINNDILRELITEKLKQIPDLDRYQRKLQLKMISPQEFVTLFKAYTIIVELYKIVCDSNTKLQLLLFQNAKEFNECLMKILTKYDMDKLYNSRVEGQRLDSLRNIFHSGGDQIADDYCTKLSDYDKKLNNILGHLNNFLSKTRGKKLTCDTSSLSKKQKELSSVGFFTTSHKAKVLKSVKVNEDVVGNLQFTNINKDVMITSDLIAGILSSIGGIKTEMSEYFYRSFISDVSDLSGCNFFQDISNFIKKLDYIKSNAVTAIKYKYYKPELVVDKGETSWLDIKEIRHPIVERIIDSEYITNDVSLGNNPNNPDKNIGLLLFAPNALGKSTLAKAIGLNIILAQAGCYTACKLKYKPYKQIITRLSGNDSILEGKSSFVVEMTELRTILRCANSRTLVIGDELCRGTESVSGTTLTITTLSTLTERNTSYIFSTHMHHLVENSVIKGLGDKMRIAHLVLKHDKENDCLIYDRKLKDGPGDSIYGLEIAKSLSLDKNFIDTALEIRRDLTNSNTNFLSTKKSRYNSNVYIDQCMCCGKKVDLETHHINEQVLSDKNGYINHYHKNSSFNLVILCEECHVKLHTNGLKIETLQTSKGDIVNIVMK